MVSFSDAGVDLVSAVGDVWSIAGEVDLKARLATEGERTSLPAAMQSIWEPDPASFQVL